MITTFFQRKRLQHGMFWKYHYPGPWDYKTKCRFVGACLLILILAILAVGKLDADASLVQEQITSEPALELAAACATQAYLHDTTDKKMNIGWVVDGKLVSVNCHVISREAYKNLRSM